MQGSGFLAQQRKGTHGLGMKRELSVLQRMPHARYTENPVFGQTIHGMLIYSASGWSFVGPAPAGTGSAGLTTAAP